MQSRSRGAMRAGFVKQRYCTARSPDGAERNPGTTVKLERCSRISLRFIRATKKEIRKRNAGRRCLTTSAPAGAAAPRISRLAPTRPLSGALACRRSTTALAKESISSPRRDPGQASWLRRPRGGLHAADAAPTSSDAPRAPVVVPAGMMPGPPGSGSQLRPRAPTSPRRPAMPAGRVLSGEV